MLDQADHPATLAIPTAPTSPCLPPDGAPPVSPAEAVALVARLRQTFPRAFARDRPPLVIGIHTAIRAAMPEVWPEVIAAALALWTSQENYQASLACRHRRVGLDGKATAERPTEDMALEAVHRLARLVGRPPGHFDVRALHPLFAWADAFRNRVAQSGSAEILAGDELRRALRILSNHPEVARKIAGGVTGIIVRPSAQGGVFVIRAKNGTEDTFSIARCFATLPREEVLSRPRPKTNRRQPARLAHTSTRGEA